MMIESAAGILGVLLLVEGLVLRASGSRRFSRFLRFPPAVFWIYFLPMVLSGLRVIPGESVIYEKASSWVLPASLLLLLAGTDFRAILKLGKTALGTMIAGSFGIALGAPLIFWIFRPLLPADAWYAFGTLSASWTGGSANMIAVKEALSVPDPVFLPMILVDTVVAYSWMGLLMVLAPFAKSYDRWNGSDRTIVDSLSRKALEAAESESPEKTPSGFLRVVLTAVLGSAVSILLARYLPSVPGISGSARGVIAATGLGILLSLTPVRHIAKMGGTDLGYGLLYFVLATLGARAALTQAAEVPVFVLAGFVWLLVHAALLLAVSRFFKIPLCVLATASQANVGGPVSAPLVAAVYEPALAPAGLLLGVLGNVFGTYLGLAVAGACYLLAGG